MLSGVLGNGAHGAPRQKGRRIRTRIAPGRNLGVRPRLWVCRNTRRVSMHELIYLIGLIVVIMAILSFFGLR
jgi:hypothetical protein